MAKPKTGTDEHARLSKYLLGDLSLGKGIQAELDAHSQAYPGVHRLVDHDPRRLREIAERYGALGLIEIAIHIALDWDWFPEWTEIAIGRKNKRKCSDHTSK
jgi:hypothetical protein